MEQEAETPLEKDALEYLKKHQIIELFQNMMAVLVFNRPKNPRYYLATYLDDLNRARFSGTGGPCLMDDTNVKSLFNLLDPTSKGYVSMSQYQQAMKTLGIKHYNESPAGWEVNQIDFDTFKRQVEQGLRDTWATFSDENSNFTRAQ